MHSYERDIDTRIEILSVFQSICPSHDDIMLPLIKQSKLHGINVKKRSLYKKHARPIIGTYKTAKIRFFAVFVIKRKFFLRLYLQFSTESILQMYIIAQTYLRFCKTNGSHMSISQEYYFRFRFF